MDRRSFITLSAIGSAGLLAGSCTTIVKENEKTTDAVLKLSSQEGVAPGDSLTEKLDFLEEHGFTGIEPHGGNLAQRVDEFEKALQNRNMKISAVVAGFQGFLIAKDPAVRKQASDSMKVILEAAGALKSEGLIMVPAFNHQESLPHIEAREMLVEKMQELGAFAAQHNTRILLEPLNRREAWFLRLLADAAAIAKDSGSEGVGVMGDFWHMTWEETSDLGAIISAGDYLHHMHIASRKNRIMPGEDEGDNYVEGFKGLKHIGYQKFISLECGSEGDRRETIPAAARLITEQWGKASMTMKPTEHQERHPQL
ncbi:MAG: sugar phosphate isomerase/epimerase [Bacteroidetes bacterium]|nr:MAG: sugar phosphate isomerase/epimerase [Bacteroidota bacterium]